MYKCSKCGLAVIVYDGQGKILEKPLRPCECDAPIIMDMHASVVGKSGIKG